MRLHRSFLGSTERAAPKTRWEHMSRREELIDQIKHEEERIAALQSDIADRRARLKAFREELSSLALEPRGVFVSTAPLPRVNPPASNVDKLIRFRSLFRGREDVFSLRWENPKTGRTGFSPACAKLPPTIHLLKAFVQLRSGRFEKSFRHSMTNFEYIILEAFHDGGHKFLRLQICFKIASFGSSIRV